jgi:hypothetical protein
VRVVNSVSVNPVVCIDTLWSSMDLGVVGIFIEGEYLCVCGSLVSDDEQWQAVFQFNEVYMPNLT